MLYKVDFTPEAQVQLAGIYRYIADAASPTIAKRYTDAVVTYCETLAKFPGRAPGRNDIRAGLRITHYKGRTIIAFAIDEKTMCVSIIGVFYGGQDYETALQIGSDE